MDPRPCGSGAVYRSSPKEDGRVGPVPPPDVARPGHPIGGGPDGGVPRSRQNPASCLSLSLSLPLILSLLPLVLSHLPGPVRASLLESHLGRGWAASRVYRWPESTAQGGAGLASAEAAAVPFSPLSPRQSLEPLPATRVAGKSGSAYWHCGDPGHFIDRCPVMEVEALIPVPDAPQAAPDQAGLYQIHVSIKGVPISLWWIQVVTRP